MIRPTPMFTRTDTLFPYPTLFLSTGALRAAGRQGILAGCGTHSASVSPRACRVALWRDGGLVGRQCRSGCRWAHHLCGPRGRDDQDGGLRSEEHTSELQSLMRNSYDVFFLKTKTNRNYITYI